MVTDRPPKRHHWRERDERVERTGERKQCCWAFVSVLRVSLVQLFVKVHNEKVEFSKSA